MRITQTLSFNTISKVGVFISSKNWSNMELELSWASTFRILDFSTPRCSWTLLIDQRSSKVGTIFRAIIYMRKLNDKIWQSV